MIWLAGADGCHYGWFRASIEMTTGDVRFHLLATASELVETEPRPQVVAVDIPIGLPDAGQRECDREARRLLGRPRMSSVFPAPIRPAIQAETREEASKITRRVDGRSVGRQAWGIYPKVREVDEWLRSSRELRNVVREVHPEVCFWAWSGNKPMTTAKKKPAGKAERLLLAEAWLGKDVLKSARATHLHKHLEDDDILDAIAALWSAVRIANGEAKSIPEIAEEDSAGLTMEIVY